MNYKEVKLTTGRMVKVYAPPVLKLYGFVTKKHESDKPQKKIVTETTAAGREISMLIEDDPEYERDMEEWDEKIDKEVQELNTLRALKDEHPPDDYDISSLQATLSYSRPDYIPRKTPEGERLDWIEWELLGNPVDTARVQTAINDLISVDLEVVEQIEESFPDQVEG